MTSDEDKRYKLGRVARRVAAYEQTLTEGLRGFCYSTNPTGGGGEASTKYVFQDGQVIGIDAALARVCLVAMSYGLDDC